MRHSLTALACLCLASLASVLIAAPAPPQKTIACEDRGMYIGNIIDAAFSLKIQGGSKQTWEYRFTDTHSGTRPATKLEAAGTYELVDDLAVFTGTLTSSDEKKAGEVRFALNYGSPGGRVEFDRFFPAAGGVLRYHRKLFEKRDGEWRPREERVLTMPRTPPPAEGKWRVTFTGERVRWERDGKESRQKVEEEVVYEKGDGGVWTSAKPVSWPPTSLAPQVKDGEVLSVGGFGYNYLAVLRGFHPFLATLPLKD